SGAARAPPSNSGQFSLESFKSSSAAAKTVPAGEPSRKDADICKALESTSFLAASFTNHSSIWRFQPLKRSRASGSLGLFAFRTISENSTALVGEASDVRRSAKSLLPSLSQSARVSSFDLIHRRAMSKGFGLACDLTSI